MLLLVLVLVLVLVPVRRYMHNYLPIFEKAAIIIASHSLWGGWHHVEVHDDPWRVAHSPILSPPPRLRLAPAAALRVCARGKDVCVQGGHARRSCGMRAARLLAYAEAKHGMATTKKAHTAARSGREMAVADPMHLLASAPACHSASCACVFCVIPKRF